MRHIVVAAATLFTLGSSQFVFFGNGRQPPAQPQQSFRPLPAPAPQTAFAQPASPVVTPVQPAPVPAPQRFGVSRPQVAAARVPTPVQTSRFNAGRFSNPFFRPDRNLMHPSKNPLPKEKPEDIKLVEILTEKPVVAESARSSSDVAATVKSVVLPAAVSPNPVTTTTKAP